MWSCGSKRAVLLILSLDLAASHIVREQEMDDQMDGSKNESIQIRIAEGLGLLLDASESASRAEPGVFCQQKDRKKRCVLPDRRENEVYVYAAGSVHELQYDTDTYADGALHRYLLQNEIEKHLQTT